MAEEEIKQEETIEQPKEEKEVVEEKPSEEQVEEEEEIIEEDSDKVEKVKVNGKEVSQEKVEAVKNLAEKMKTSKTIMLVSIRSLPSPQLQKIKKDLRGKADVQVIKKSILTRAIDATKIPEMAALKEHLEADNALALSNDDAFELAAWLTENRNPIAAKIGQEATDDIHVEAGPTDLMPGPDISALGNVGLQVAVEEGKIAIKTPYVILKKGETVTENIASVLLKLDIKPFMIGLNPTVIYDSKSKKIYVGVKIDKKEALNDLLTAQGKAIGLARNLNIITKDTIGYLLAKANAEMKALESLAPTEPATEDKSSNDKQPSKEGSDDTNKETEAKVDEQEKPAEEENKEEVKEEKKDDTENKPKEETKSEK